MARRKTVPNLGPRDEAAPAKLMDFQDTLNKGDGSPKARKKKVQISFWVSEERRDEIRRYAEEHEMTVSRLVVEGLNWRLKQD